MNVHDDARTDRPGGELPTDDEVTTDVDPAWIATIRSELDHEARDPDAGSDAHAEVDDEHWRDAEPSWDPEATVGVSDGLIERIRAEISAAPQAPAISSPPASAAPPSIPAPPPVTELLDQPPVGASVAPPSVDLPPASGRSAVTDVDRETSTTVRWEPRQRLTTTAPVNEGVVIAPTPTSSLDRTKVAIAIVVAIAVVVIVWLLVGSGGGDSPPPTDSVPSSVDGSTPPASVAVDPDLDGAGG